MIAPVVAISRELRHALGNKEATLQACRLLPAGTPLRVYIVIENDYDMFVHADIEEYCRRNKIDFQT